MGLLSLLLVVALALNCTMYATGRSSLGFASAIFWFLAGIQSLVTLHTGAAWSDIYYYLFIVCSIGMTIVCAVSSLGMRKKDTEPVNEDVVIAKDTASPELLEEDEEKPRQSAVRERAEKRRERLGGNS
jgi:hypothetical protein